MSKQARELREMSGEQLAFTLQEAQKTLFELRFKSAAEKLDTPSQLRKLRRHIARIHTIQSQKERELSGAT